MRSTSRHHSRSSSAKTFYLIMLPSLCHHLQNLPIARNRASADFRHALGTRLASDLCLLSAPTPPTPLLHLLTSHPPSFFRLGPFAPLRRPRLHPSRSRDHLRSHLLAVDRLGSVGPASPPSFILIISADLFNRYFLPFLILTRAQVLYPSPLAQVWLSKNPRYRYDKDLLESLCFSRAFEGECCLVMVNPGGTPHEVGNDAEHGFFGGSGVWMPLQGRVAVATKWDTEGGSASSVDLSVLEVSPRQDRDRSRPRNEGGPRSWLT